VVLAVKMQQIQLVRVEQVVVEMAEEVRFLEWLAALILAVEEVVLVVLLLLLD
jgi:hypothetical protein